MSGAYPDSNEDITFWSDVKSLSGGHYPGEEMALLTADKPSAGHKTSPSPSPDNKSSSTQSALVKWESPKTRSSYNFNEVAINLQTTAEKALEDNSPDSGYRSNSVAQGVARIVLEESNNVVDSSREYIAGVVRKVARYAQDAGHDGESSNSAANQVIQPATTSLGTMVSFFVIWCVSLCASHMDSKDLPAPALKLAAEEVASVLQSNRSSRSGTAL